MKMLTDIFKFFMQVCLILSMWLNNPLYSQNKVSPREFGLTTHGTSASMNINSYGFNVEQLVDTNQIELLFNKVFDAHGTEYSIHSNDVRRYKVNIQANQISMGFRQVYKGIPVENTDLGMTLNPSSGIIYSFGGRYYNNIHIDNVKPVLTAMEAWRRSTQDTIYTGTDSLTPPKLVIYPVKNGDSVEFHVAWDILHFSVGIAWRSYVDAKNGTILLKYNAIQNSAGGAE